MSKDTPRCNEIDYEAPESPGVHYLRLLCLARNLETALASAEQRIAVLQRNVENLLSIIDEHDPCTNDYQDSYIRCARKSLTDAARQQEPL